MRYTNLLICTTLQFQFRCQLHRSFLNDLPDGKVRLSSHVTHDKSLNPAECDKVEEDHDIFDHVAWLTAIVDADVFFVTWNVLILIEVVMIVPVICRDESLLLLTVHPFSLWAVSNFIVIMEAHRPQLFNEEQNVNVVTQVLPVSEFEIPGGTVRVHAHPFLLCVCITLIIGLIYIACLVVVALDVPFHFWPRFYHFV